MEIVIQISALFALVAFFILCIYAIFSLRKMGNQLNQANISIKKAADSIEIISKKAEKTFDEIIDFKNKAAYSLKHIDDVSEEMKVITSKGVDNLEKFAKIFQPVEMLMQGLYFKLAPPLHNVANIINAASKASSVFFDKFLKKNETQK